MIKAELLMLMPALDRWYHVTVALWDGEGLLTSAIQRQQALTSITIYQVSFLSSLESVTGTAYTL